MITRHFIDVESNSNRRHLRNRLVASRSAMMIQNWAKILVCILADALRSGLSNSFQDKSQFDEHTDNQYRLSDTNDDLQQVGAVVRETPEIGRWSQGHRGSLNPLSAKAYHLARGSRT